MESRRYEDRRQQENSQTNLEIMTATNLTRELETPSYEASGFLSNMSFSDQEHLELLRYAGLLMDFDDETKTEEIREALAKSLGIDERVEDMVPGTALYRSADAFNIPRKYVERAYLLRHPSDKQMLLELDDVGGILTRDQIFNSYKTTILRGLEATFPTGRFRGERNQHREGWPMEVFEFGGLRKRLLFSNKEIWNHLARIFINYPINRRIRIELCSPKILQACGDKIKRLNEYFGFEVDIEADYPIELDGII